MFEVDFDIFLLPDAGALGGRQEKPGCLAHCLSVWPGSAAAQGPIISSYDPPPAQVWEQSLRLACGRTTLRIAGYGVSRPHGRPVAITVDGRPLTGAAVESLRRDLSGQHAVYRLGGLCPRDAGRIALVIQIGERTGTGPEYRTASAMIVGGRLQAYTGLAPTEASGFWFR